MSALSRRFTIILLALLLPLHGWAAALMPLQMAAAPIKDAPEYVAENAYFTVGELGNDVKNADHSACHELSADAGVETPADCGPCAACAVCHTLALDPLTAPAAAHPPSHALPASLRAAAYAVALPTPAKPPQSTL